MQFLYDVGTFAANTFLIVLAILIVLAFFFSMTAKGKQRKGQLEVENLNEKFHDMSEAVKSIALDKKDFKNHKKSEKKEKKKEKKATKEKQRVFVIDFDGDIKASAVQNLRNEISAVLGAAKKQDEVVVRVESPGGMVHAYGLAASQLARIREKEIPLTICVDKVAASGGYMMACVGHKIIAAPFAIIGSIGVMAQVPNFHRLLKKHDVDYNEYTAGEYKRTVSLMGEITEKGKKKFIEDMEETHVLFKQFVKKNREQVDVNQIATGEHWYGQKALDLKLVDHLQTSDDYLIEKTKTAEVLHIQYAEKKKFGERFSLAMGSSLKRVFVGVFEYFEKRRLFS